MIFPLLPATLLLVTAGLITLNYFVPPEQDAPAPDTEPIQQPFTPPFTGGQCDGGRYTAVVRVDWINTLNNAQSTTINVPFSVGGQVPLFGAISGVTATLEAPDMGYSVKLQHKDSVGNPANRIVFEGFGGIKSGLTAAILSVARIDGADSCGDLPNPNPPISIPSSGLAQSAPPDLQDSELLSQGIVPLNLAAILAAALAALRVATTIAEAVAALADALEAIKKAIDKLLPKERDKNKSFFRYVYGGIEKDGFLRFYGDVSNQGFEAVYLDILFTNIPSGYGKYFGTLSPNRYIYNRLGYIAFVSPSLGVMEVRELEFPRQSFSVPRDSIGFFYHLGLDGVIKANASAIYEKEEVPAE